MKYCPSFYDPLDCDAWHGPVSSRLLWFTGNVADFIFDQLYDWCEIA